MFFLSSLPRRWSRPFSSPASRQGSKQGERKARRKQPIHAFTTAPPVPVPVSCPLSSVPERKSHVLRRSAVGCWVRRGLWCWEERCPERMAQYRGVAGYSYVRARPFAQSFFCLFRIPRSRRERVRLKRATRLLSSSYWCIHSCCCCSCCYRYRPPRVLGVARCFVLFFLFFFVYLFLFPPVFGSFRLNTYEVYILYSHRAGVAQCHSWFLHACCTAYSYPFVLVVSCARACVQSSPITRYCMHGSWLQEESVVIVY